MRHMNSEQEHILTKVMPDVDCDILNTLKVLKSTSPCLKKKQKVPGALQRASSEEYRVIVSFRCFTLIKLHF